ncbi:MAG: VacJ family lipoprotein [Pseudomonadota bacterium]
MKHTDFISNNFKQITAGLLIVATLTLSGCSQEVKKEKIVAQESISSNNNDPLESINRGIFKFNEMLDGVLLKPLAHIYRGVMPEAAQTGVKNALGNMAAPVVLVNSALQGDYKNSQTTVERFAINSTLGVAGIFDVADKFGIKKENHKDFGQTLGVYGVGTGPYLVLPILGASNTRDTVGIVADIFADPFTYILTSEESIARSSLKGIVKRGDYIGLIDKIYRESLDPYSTFRSIYGQNRNKVSSRLFGKNR